MAHCLIEPRVAYCWLAHNVPEVKMDTRAVLEGNEWVLSGSRRFISNGYDVSLYGIYANTDHTMGMAQGTSGFLVPRNSAGLDVIRAMRLWANAT